MKKWMSIVALSVIALLISGCTVTSGSENDTNGSQNTVSNIPSEYSYQAEIVPELENKIDVKYKLSSTIEFGAEVILIQAKIQNLSDRDISEVHYIIAANDSSNNVVYEPTMGSNVYYPPLVKPGEVRGLFEITLPLNATNINIIVTEIK